MSQRESLMAKGHGQYQTFPKECLHQNKKCPII